MNNIHNNGPDDKLLNDELEELGHTYQQNSSEEPPELLDQAILNRAHRAVEKKDHWLDFGWVHGLTTAAVVVLALSIILTQHQPAGPEENGSLQELSKEVSRKAHKDAGQVMPAASAPETQTGARAEAVSASDAAGDFRAMKSIQSEDPLLREEILEANEPAETRFAKPSTVGFADESVPAEEAEIEVDAIKLDEDKIDTERLQSATEEEQVQAILMMKNAGDIRWEAELKIFIENHPDYPLPDELKN